jgi:hypothetical protein
VQKEFRRILKLAKLDGPEFDFSPHSMRHTFATLHILAGDDPKWVSEQLGHADVTVTFKIYAKWFKQVSRGAADAHGVRLFSYRRSEAVGSEGNGGAERVGSGMASTTLPADENAAPVLH